MRTVFFTALQRAQWYIGDGWHYLLFALALVFLILNRKEKENRTWLAFYSIAFGAVYLCPVTAWFIMRFCTGDLVYWRMLWLLPTSVVIAYVAAKLCMNRKRAGTRLLCMVMLTLVIVFAGENPYVGEDAAYVQAENIEKLPQDVCEVCDMINESLEEGERAVAVIPDDLNGYVRQYDASIELAYGRRSKLTGSWRKIRKLMRRERPRWRVLIPLMREAGANYLVYPSDEKQNRRIQKLGFTRIGEVGIYQVYKG